MKWSVVSRTGVSRSTTAPPIPISVRSRRIARTGSARTHPSYFRYRRAASARRKIDATAAMTR
ncbi:MAG: hypothetical protein AUK27_02235 [Deltaproteobacteria bacterium CG2_30_66_27]|nr:MAG: hypothetical protein AUK27_02235 [Deltaproteobacteria bacterium CG2_30_66_27]